MVSALACKFDGCFIIRDKGCVRRGFFVHGFVVYFLGYGVANGKSRFITSAEVSGAD